MKLSTIGSGNIGKSIGSWAAKVGYEVTFSAKNQQHAEEAASQAGHNATAADIKSAAASGDLILLAIPYSAVQEALSNLKSELKGKVIIDATNPLSPDYSSLSVGFNSSAAEEIAKMLPESLIVKAFNTVFAQVFASQNPKINDRLVSIFYAGDDENSKKKVAELVSKMGFDPVDAGPLKSARIVEPMALMNITLGYALKHGTSIGFSLLR